MANTTNFNWETPDDTDLVKDGAAAIRTLGSAIDTSLVDLKGGTTGQVLSKATNTDMDFTWVAQDDSNAIQNAIVDAKGDIITATAADTPVRLAVGTNGTVLSADSTEATGLKWITVSGGGMTLLTSGTLSGSSTNLSSISGSYNNLWLVINDFYPSTNSGFKVRANSLTTGYLGSGTYNAGGTAGVGSTYDDQIGFITNIPNSSKDNVMILEIIDYTNTDAQKFYNFYCWYVDTGNTNSTTHQHGKIGTTSAITSIQMITNSGTWSAGSYKLYGVK